MTDPKTVPAVTAAVIAGVLVTESGGGREITITLPDGSQVCVSPSGSEVAVTIYGSNGNLVGVVTSVSADPDVTPGVVSEDTDLGPVPDFGTDFYYPDIEEEK